MGGCFSSKFETRNSSLFDFNLLQANFIGGQERVLSKDVCPVDKLSLNYISKKSELTDGMCKESYEIFQISSKTLMFEDDAKNTADTLLKEIARFFDNMVEHIENQIRRSPEFKAEKLGHKYLPGEALTQAKQF